MLTIESLIRAWKTETDICVSLFGKIPPGGLDFRPTPGQRNTIELLRYLAYGPRNGVVRILAGDWKATPPAMEMAKDMPPSDFVQVMHRHADEVARLLRAADPVDLERGTITFPWGQTLSKGEGIVLHPYRWFAGYRMQLFLYLKAAGASQLSTPDLWHPPATGA